MSGDASPLHVHVDEETPVHVHVEKPRNLVSSTLRSVAECELAAMRGQRSPGSSAGRRSPTRSSLRSPKAPWVPAPGKTTRGNRVTFEGSRGTLELGPYYNSMSRSELDDDKDTDTVVITAKARDYEKKITGLMREVGGLRNEIEERRDAAELLDQSAEELRDTRRDLWEKERENRRLRESMDDLRHDVDTTKNMARSLSSEREKLLKKLIETEMDGQEAVRQASTLKDVVKRLKTENKMSNEDLKLLSIQRETLTERLGDFEGTNRTLRRMLQDQHASETEQQRLGEQKTILINKFAACEEDNERLRAEIKELERRLMDSKIQLRTQTDETMASATLQSSLEQTRAHLQRELRQREADCNRMAVQIRTLESEMAQEKIEVDHLQELLRQAHHKHEKDKEALKKATRIQKQRATKSESAVDQLNLANMEKDQRLSELQAMQDEQKAMLNSAAREKASLATPTLSPTPNLSISDYRHTVASLRGEIQLLARKSYAKDYEIHRLQDELRKSCKLMEGVLQRQNYLIEKTRSKSTEILAKNSAAQLRSNSLERKRPVNTAGRMIPVGKSQSESCVSESTKTGDFLTANQELSPQTVIRPSAAKASRIIPSDRITPTDINTIRFDELINPPNTPTTDFLAKSTSPKSFNEAQAENVASSQPELRSARLQSDCKLVKASPEQQRSKGSDKVLLRKPITPQVKGQVREVRRTEHQVSKLRSRISGIRSAAVLDLSQEKRDGLRKSVSSPSSTRRYPAAHSHSNSSGGLKLGKSIRNTSPITMKGARAEITPRSPRLRAAKTKSTAVDRLASPTCNNNAKSPTHNPKSPTQQRKESPKRKVTTKKSKVQFVNSEPGRTVTSRARCSEPSGIVTGGPGSSEPSRTVDGGARPKHVVSKWSDQTGDRRQSSGKPKTGKGKLDGQTSTRSGKKSVYFRESSCQCNDVDIPRQEKQSDGSRRSPLGRRGERLRRTDMECRVMSVTESRDTEPHCAKDAHSHGAAESRCNGDAHCHGMGDCSSEKCDKQLHTPRDAKDELVAALQLVGTHVPKLTQYRRGTVVGDGDRYNAVVGYNHVQCDVVCKNTDSATPPQEEEPVAYLRTRSETIVPHSYSVTVTSSASQSQWEELIRPMVDREVQSKSGCVLRSDDRVMNQRERERTAQVTDTDGTIRVAVDRPTSLVLDYSSLSTRHDQAVPSRHVTYAWDSEEEAPTRDTYRYHVEDPTALGEISRYPETAEVTVRQPSVYLSAVSLLSAKNAASCPSCDLHATGAVSTLHPDTESEDHSLPRRLSACSNMAQKTGEYVCHHSHSAPSNQDHPTCQDHPACHYHTGCRDHPVRQDHPACVYMSRSEFKSHSLTRPCREGEEGRRSFEERRQSCYLSCGCLTDCKLKLGLSVVDPNQLYLRDLCDLSYSRVDCDVTIDPHCPPCEHRDTHKRQEDTREQQTDTRQDTHRREEDTPEHRRHVRETIIRRNMEIREAWSHPPDNPNLSLSRRDSESLLQTRTDNPSFSQTRTDNANLSQHTFVVLDDAGYLNRPAINSKTNDSSIPSAVRGDQPMSADFSPERFDSSEESSLHTEKMQGNTLNKPSKRNHRYPTCRSESHVNEHSNSMCEQHGMSRVYYGALDDHTQNQSRTHVTQSLDNVINANVAFKNEMTEHGLSMNQSTNNNRWSPARHAPSQDSPALHRPAQHAPTQDSPALHRPARHAPTQDSPALHRPARHAHAPRARMPADKYCRIRPDSVCPLCAEDAMHCCGASIRAPNSSVNTRTEYAVAERGEEAGDLNNNNNNNIDTDDIDNDDRDSINTGQMMSSKNVSISLSAVSSAHNAQGAGPLEHDMSEAHCRSHQRTDSRFLCPPKHAREGRKGYSPSKVIHSGDGGTRGTCRTVKCTDSSQLSPPHDDKVKRSTSKLRATQHINSTSSEVKQKSDSSVGRQLSNVSQGRQLSKVSHNVEKEEEEDVQTDAMSPQCDCHEDVCTKPYYIQYSDDDSDVYSSVRYHAIAYHSEKLAKLASQIRSISKRLSDIERLLSEAEDKQRQITDQSNTDNHNKNQQLHQLKSECERMKTTLLTVEERCSSLEAESRSLESQKHEMEKTVRDYKTRAERGEQESDVLTRKLTEAASTLDRVKMESSIEIERVRQRLEDRLGELEPLPEMLKTAELRLHEATDRLVSVDRSCDEKSQMVAELTNKIERQAGDVDMWREKYKTLETSMNAKLEALERRLKDVESKNTELMISLSHKEEALNKTNYKLEERTTENSTLARQLETSLADSRRLGDDAREKSAYKERALQDRLRDLEEQLTNQRAEAAKARREKEEIERKFNSKVYDLKDRLEQSHATNRSMQNYVQFLKSSYASVMGDVSASSPISPVRASSSLREGAGTSLRQPHF